MEVVDDDIAKVTEAIRKTKREVDEAQGNYNCLMRRLSGDHRREMFERSLSTSEVHPCSPREGIVVSKTPAPTLRTGMPKPAGYASDGRSEFQSSRLHVSDSHGRGDRSVEKSEVLPSKPQPVDEVDEDCFFSSVRAARGFASRREPLYRGELPPAPSANLRLPTFTPGLAGCGRFTRRRIN